MLSPSDFNNAVPQFTNGNYASNPINPQYIAEPDAVSYNRGTEPLQTLPAQWWNWFLNKFTGRFNKVNVYVKNIFNELAQVLSIFEITPDGTEATPTTTQLKTVFECCYPEYVKTTANLASASTTVNGHPLSSDVTVTRNDLGLGTSATVNTGTAVGCIPTVGTALGTTNNNILVTDASGNLKPSGITVGTAAGCDATAFRSCTWTPALVECANKGKNGSSYSAFGSNAFNSTAFTTCTGTVTKVKVGSTEYTPSSGVVSLPAYPSIPTCVACAGKVKRNAYTNAYLFTVALTNGCSTADGTDLYASCKCLLTFCSTTGVLTAACFCGTASNATKACCASCNGSGVAFGTAATCAASAFLATNGCAYDSARLGTASSTCYLKVDGCTKVYLDTVYSKTPTTNNSNKNLYFGASYKDEQGTVHTLCSCICGANGYYYGNICGNVCGAASCHYYTSLLKICHECQSCSYCLYCCGRLFLCNTASYPVRPILLPDAQYYNPPSTNGEFVECMRVAICRTYPWLFCDHIEFCTLRDFLGIPNSGVTSGRPRPPLVLQANQKLYLASSSIYWCCAALVCKVLGCALTGVGYY